MNYPLLLARRLSLSSGGRKASPAVRVAVAAVAISVVVMIAAVAIVTGFKHEIISRLRGFNADVSVTVAPSPSGEYDNIVTLTPSLRESLSSLPFVTDYSLQVSAPAVVKTSTDFKGVYMRSLSSRNQTGFFKNALTQGRLPDFTADPERGWPDSVNNQMLVSALTADRLGLKAGDKVDLYFITDRVRARRMTVTGVYDSHFESYDDMFIFGSPALIRQTGSLSPVQGTSMSIVTDDFSRVDEYAAAIGDVLARDLAEGRIYKPLRVDSLRNLSGNFFNWLQLLDMNVVVVLTLMTVVACITLVSGMLIVIVDKKRFIALMKALGMPGRRLRRVFIYLAMRVTIVGMLLGDAIGIGLTYLQKTTHIIPLDPDSYYIDFVPMEISWGAILALNIGVLVISYIVLILPARFVGSVSPAQVLSTE